MARITRARNFPLLWLAALVGLLWLAPQAQAQRVTGSLSSSTGRVGEPVNYELSIVGSFNTGDAPAPNVDGLEVRGTSHGSQLLINNGDVSRRTTITYRLVPQREGTFTIPPLEMTVEGKKLTTRALTLTVGPAAPAADAGDLAFAEIRLAKKSPYVGEAVPIEVRLYLESGPRWELRQQPVLSGSGFTLQPFGKFSEQPVEMAGKNYIAVTFRSVITPGKAGEITIGPLPVKTVYSEQMRGTPFGMFSRPGRVRELEVIAPAVTMNAQLLPAAGRPADFSGAIGKFEFEGVGTPNRVNIGEPVQMVLKVTGEGNFDRVGVPPLAEPDGWRVYDAEQNFESTDELGFSGTKTFSLPVAPATRKATMPVFSFTYFDPEKGAYETLKTAATPLTVTGAEPPPAPAVESAATADEPAADPAAAPPAQPEDILGILPGRGRAWSPGLAYSTPLLTGLVLAPVPLIALALLWRRRMRDHEARRRQMLKRDRAAHLQTVRDSSDPASFYNAAAHVLQIDAALASGAEAYACELEDILGARALNAETQTAVEELFNARAALVYAGGNRGGDAIRAADRDRVLETLAAYERSAPR